jgi:hypothetical protein
VLFIQGKGSSSLALVWVKARLGLARGREPKDEIPGVMRIEASLLREHRV